MKRATPEADDATFRPRAAARAAGMKDDVLEVLQQKREQIVDARSNKEFCGVDLAKNKRGGAIPARPTSTGPTW